MEFIYTEPLSAGAAMEFSLDLLNSLKDKPRCIFQIYNWKNRCATYGYFTNPEKYLNLNGLKKQNIEIARRPTGGGILFHLSDLAFAFYLPANHPRYSINTLENYAAVNGAVLSALKKWAGINQGHLLVKECSPYDQASQHFCMAKPTRYDVCIGGLKVAGGAQRRIGSGLLHQGSITLKKMDPVMLKEILLPDTCVVESMEKNSYPDLQVSPQTLAKALEESFTREFL